MNKNIFLSYSHKNADLANEIDNALYTKGIRVTRDIRDVQCSQSFKEFMKSIGSHDIVLMLISDQYLKSQACMFEVIETMKESDYIEKIRTIVDDNVCFDLDGITYLEYWEENRQVIEEVIKKHRRETVRPLEEKIDEIILIENNIMEFIATVRDRKYIPSESLNNRYTDLYKAIGIENINVVPDYDTVNEGNVSVGPIKRHSINIVIDKYHPKCEIKEAIKEIVFSLKPNNDVVWIFAYYKLDDIVNINWFCKGYWVSPNLDQRWRPIEMKSNDQIEDIKISWNDEYESRRDVYNSHSGSKSEILEFTDSLLRQVVPITKTAIEKFDQFQNDEINESEFLKYIHKEQPIERELYFLSMERKSATYECNDYIQRFDGLFAIIDNIFMYYSIECTNTWSSENKRILMRRDKENFYEELAELNYERKKLK